MNWIEIGSVIVGFLLGVTALKPLASRALKFALKFRFWVRHGRKGKVILFVYSDSSIWKDHIEAKILPSLEGCSVILNWSKRREWESSMQFEAGLFNQWAGSGEFAPTAILFPLMGRTRVFRLWQSSDNPKHGRDKALKVSKEAEQSLLAAVKQVCR